MSASFLSGSHLELRARARAAFSSLEPSSPITDAQLKAEVARLGFYPYLVPAAYGGVSAKVEGDEWYAAACLAGEAGLRVGEVKALRWREDVDMVAKTITVNQQPATRRRLPRRDARGGRFR